MHLNIVHTTRYTYDAPVDYGLQQVRLTPPSTVQQTVTEWALEVGGGKIETSYVDHNGSHVNLVSVDRGGTEVVITARGSVETHDTSGILGKIQGTAPLWYYEGQTPSTHPGKAISVLAGQLKESDDLLTGLHGLSAAILLAVPYKTGETYTETSAEDALLGGHGVCQDHAQIFAATARAAGVPARYVSGYLMMDDQIDQDASHAWAEAHVDGLGWVGFDVSNGISPDGRYVRLATGLDYRQAAPISGMRLGDAKESMSVFLQVQQ